MRVTHVLSITVLLAGCQTMQSQNVAKAEILSATRAWADAVNTCNPARISALYDLAGTLLAMLVGGRLARALGVIST